MKCVLSFFKKIDYRHYICVGISVAFILINIFCFPYTFPRLGEAFRDFGLSIGYHYANVLQLETDIVPTVTALSDMPFTLSDKVPQTWDIFKEKWHLYWQTFAEEQTFFNYLFSYQSGALILSFVLSFAVPVIGLFVLIAYLQLNSKNNY